MSVTYLIKSYSYKYTDIICHYITLFVPISVYILVFNCISKYKYKNNLSNDIS